ncbi:MAG: hypothetical protein ABIH49_01760 [archaeon]
MAVNEEKIRALTSFYYSNPEIQKAIFEFSRNREITPSYMMEGFGKRPDSFQYKGDIFELVKKGATSFHCSEELWSDPLKLSTNLNKSQMDDLRIGWDLLIDIDCKWFDYSKKAAEAIINVFKKHSIKNIGIKFSGNKGFHIILPWESFPKKLADEETKKLFPDLPRKIISYLRFKAENEMRESLPEDFYKQFRDVKIKKGMQCRECKEIASEINLIDYFCPSCRREESKRNPEKNDYRCPDCNISFEIKNEKIVYECKKCKTSSLENSENFSRSVEVDLFDLMGLDLILVSPRHLFRMPYSLHEKTGLSSIPFPPEKIREFDLKDAEPMKILKDEIKNFSPVPEKDEASELLMQALDWGKEYIAEKTEKNFDFKPIKLDNLSESFLPPSIRKILLGVDDGRKRALFVLINLFRSLGMENEEFEKRIYEWNKKNKIPLKDGYVKAQISWSYRNKIVPPPNFDKDYYRGIGIVPTEEELRSKNPVNYVIRKNNQSVSGKNKNKDNFKN